MNLRTFSEIVARLGARIAFFQSQMSDTGQIKGTVSKKQQICQQIHFEINQRSQAIHAAIQNKEWIMKRLLILAALIGGLTFTGFAATANAGYGGRGYGYGHAGYGHGWGCGRPGFYGYGYRRPIVAPGVYIGAPGIGVGIGTPGFGVGIGTGYPYPAPYGAYGYGY